MDSHRSAEDRPGCGSATAGTGTSGAATDGAFGAGKETVSRRENAFEAEKNNMPRPTPGDHGRTLPLAQRGRVDADGPTVG